MKAFLIFKSLIHKKINNRLTSKKLFIATGEKKRVLSSQEKGKSAYVQTLRMENIKKKKQKHNEMLSILFRYL